MSDVEAKAREDFNEAADEIDAIFRRAVDDAKIAFQKRAITSVSAEGRPEILGDVFDGYIDASFSDAKRQISW